ncbi:metal-dependent hydrolase [Halospeciosus flavus]|uniref:Metal-dependent hydrolase n=1 Tax=Halospeciosus flavus TaxID=3032283 RepID=A0ABD5Z859_9EURY|nr:metal-dependent hydrolase [Halospeciosus flavus]
MATTHAAVGTLLALPLFLVSPELAATAATAGWLGGVFPDLDVAVVEHRKTLHYPDYYWLLAFPLLGVAAAYPGPRTVAAAFFVLAAAVHSVSDVFGGSLGLRPWLADDERGVYFHSRKRWLRPRRWIRYDGSPEDLLVGTLCALPAISLFDGLLRWLLVGGIAVSVVYTTLRKKLVEWSPDWLLRL